MIIKTSKDFSNYIWLNGKIIERKSVRLDPFIHSLHYSGAVFEGERAYNGKIFKLEQHVDRLIKSAELMRIHMPYSNTEIIEAHHHILLKNKVEDAYIRPLLFRGNESINLINKDLSSNLLIACIKLSHKGDDINLHISKWRKPDSSMIPIQAKSSGHYNMMILALDEAKSLGYDDAIMLDGQGDIAECTTTNIFFVKKGHLITPLADRILDGITRQTIIEIASKLNIKVEQKRMKIDEIPSCDECFITGTAAEVKSVNSISLDKQKINFGRGKITQLLQHEYAAIVRQ